jgi:DNA polymerase-1
MDKQVKNTFAVIDGNSLFYRAYYAYPPNLTTADGKLVNAVYGFLLMFLKTLVKYKPRYVAMAFDYDRVTFRKEKFGYYKERREEADESLTQQYPILFEVLDAFNVMMCREKGFEADDFLGTFAERYKEKVFTEGDRDFPEQMLLITGDKDLKQSVGDEVKMVYITGTFSNQDLITHDSFVKEYNFEPELFDDYLALCGDSSDNIPGVRGIGKKRAKELIAKFGSLEDIYKNLDKVEEYNSRFANMLREYEEEAAQSKFLTTLKTDLDIDKDLKLYLVDDIDYSRAEFELKRLGFRSLMTNFRKVMDLYRVNQENTVESAVPFAGNSAPQKENKTIESKDFKFIGFEGWFDVLKKDSSNEVIFYRLRNDISQDDSVDKEQDRSGLFDKKEEEVDMEDLIWVCVEDQICRLDLDQLQKVQNEVERVVVYDINNYLDLFEYPFESDKYLYDIRLMSYLQNASRRDYELETIAFEFGKVDYKDYSKFVEENNLGQDFSQWSEEVQQKWLDNKFTALSRVYEVLKSNEDKYDVNDFVETHWNNVKDILDKRDLNVKDFGINGLLRHIEVPVAYILELMESRGIRIDTIGMDAMKREIKDEMEEIVEQAYELAGENFNLDSPKQVAEILYDKLEIPADKRSTAASVLVNIIEEHKIVPLILKYREVSKLYSTYVKGFEKYIDQSSGISLIHTNYKQTSVVTGRLSSEDPNLQNLPIRTDVGRDFRSLFIPRNDFRLYSFDYSQFELRLLAHFSEDQKLVKEFKEGLDVHLETASHILGKDREKIDKDERRIGKTINFGVMYGLSPYGLAKSLKIDVKTASTYINDYFEHYDGVKNYFDDLIESARDKGYVETAFGRRRYIPSITSNNNKIQGRAERTAVNMPAQGTQADLMKLSMIMIENLLRTKYSKKAFILLQIHDELVIEIKEDILKEVIDEVQTEMEAVANLKVPLKVDYKEWGVTER